MKTGGEYRLPSIGLRNWQKLAVEVRMDPDSLITLIRAMDKRTARQDRRLSPQRL